MSTGSTRPVFSARRSDQMLSLSAERDLIGRAVSGNHEAMNSLIQQNMPLVRHIARKYLSPNHPEIQLDDLAQEGSIGLWQAIQNFDLSTSHALTTFAYYRIRRAIQGHLEKQARGIRLPAYLEQQHAKIKRTSEKLEKQLGRSPTIEELARELKLPVEKLDRLLQKIEEGLKHQPLTLDLPIESGSNDPNVPTLGETLPDEGEDTDAATLRATLRRELLNLLLTALTPTQSYIIARRYGLIEWIDYDNSYRQIASEFPKKISYERVRQIEQETIEQLRQLCQTPEYQQLSAYLLEA